MTSASVDYRQPHFSGLRVAALIDTAIVSGPGRQLTALANELRAHSVTLRVYMFQRVGRPVSPFVAYMERAQIEHLVLPDRGPLDVSVLTNLGQKLRDWDPHIVQTHNYRTTVIAYLLKLTNPAWPWIAFFHGSTNENWKVRAYNKIDRVLLPQADRLVVMSERHRREFPRAGGRVSVIHNAILQLPTKGSPLDVTSLRRVGVPLLGVIGRLSPEKGIDILLQAVSLLPSGAVSLVIAGEGLARASLEQQARILGVEPHVHFVGTVEDVGYLYPQLDLVVVPSRSEGLPNVLLEALSADIPVVATAVGAIPEVLINEAAGRIVPPCNAQALADAIMQVLAEGRSNHARVARAAVAARFSLRKRVEHHLRLYGELRPELLAQNSLN